MRKIYFLLGMMLVSMMSATAQEVDNETIEAEAETAVEEVSTKSTKEKKEKTPSLNKLRDKYSQWSIAAHGGISMFDGDCYQKMQNLFPHGKGKVAVDVSIEKTFTPLYGIGVEYSYLPIGGSVYNKGLDFKGETHNMSIYGSLNLTNLFYKHRNPTWSLYFNLGLGMTVFNSHNDVNSRNKGLDGYKKKAGNGDLKNQRASQIPLALMLEWNFHRNWALSARISYRFYTKDHFEADEYVKGVTNDGVMAATIGLRYKILAGKKTHMRNISNLDDFNLDNARKMVDDECCRRNDSIAGLHAIELAAMKEKADAAEKDADDLRGQIEAIRLQLDKIMPCVNYMKQNCMCGDTADSDGDGVPDCRDREMNTPPGAFVNYWGEAIPDDYFASDKIPSVYFAIDESVVKGTKNNNTMDMIAKKMIADPSVHMEIRGYADLSGSDAYNKKLSERRVNEVKSILTTKYDIDPNRIVVNGMGKSIDKDIPEDLKRRCDFFLSSDVLTLSSAPSQEDLPEETKGIYHTPRATSAVSAETSVPATSSATGKESYRLQLFTSPKKLPVTTPVFEGLPSVKAYHENNVWKYTAGDFQTYQEAATLKEQLKAKYPGAFVVKFVDEKRVSIK